MTARDPGIRPVGDQLFRALAHDWLGLTPVIPTPSAAHSADPAQPSLDSHPLCSRIVDDETKLSSV